MRKYLIVGIDPGTTTGLAVLSLEGKVLEINSWRDISLNDLIEKILEIGNPILVSTDVAPAPDTVKKLSTKLNAELWKPDKSLSKEEKREITKNYDTENHHQLDALAATLKSFRYVDSKIRNINKRSPEDLENKKLINLVIKGKSLEEAIDELKSRKEDVDSDKRDEGNKKVSGLEKKVKDLQNQVEELKNKNKRKNQKINELKEEISKIKSKRFLSAIKSSEVRSKKKKIESLKKELSEKEKKLDKLSDLVSVSDRIDSIKEDEDKLVLKKISSFTKKNISELNKTLGIEKGDILFIKDASGGGSATADKIAEKVRAIVIENDLSHPAKNKLIKKGVPFIKSENLDLNIFENFATAKKEELNKLIKDRKKEIKKIKKERFKSKLNI